MSGDRVLLSSRGGIPVVHRRDGEVWTREASLRPPGTFAPSYGQFNALGEETAVVADHDFPAVHVFRRAGQEWTHEEVLTPPAGGGVFGWGLAISGDRVAIGQPIFEAGVWIYRRVDDGSGARWEEEQQVLPSEECRGFGFDVALEGDLLAGAPRPTS
jgi:hypothetical protein